MTIFLISFLIVSAVGPSINRSVWAWENLKKVVAFKERLKRFSDIEEEIDICNTEDDWPLRPRDRQLLTQKECKKKYPEEYNSLRQTVAEEIPCILRIASQIGVITQWDSIPPPIIGGPIVPVDIFSSVLENLGYGEMRWQTRFDTLDKMIGILKETKKVTFFQIFNPVTWCRSILRTPFIVLQATGFNIEKPEASFVGHLFKLLFFIGLLLAMLKLGFTREQISTFIFRW